MVSKVCSKCKKSKSVDYFNKQKGGKYGLRSICKNCQAKYFASYVSCPINKQNRDAYRRSKFLLDPYVKILLCKGTHLTPNMITSELVLLKRKHLLIHRKLKEINDEKRNGTTERAK